ncbi:MAG: TerB family tellurite resistance protein [Flavobacteriales bacterium]|nr:TerB family tellurite resistance protein [Flavobacteriales bacterium]
MTLFGNISISTPEAEIEDLLEGIQASFSEDQKKAILASLMRVSDADGDFHLLEEQLLRLIAGILDYDLRGSRDEIKADLFDIDAGEVLSSLGSFEEEQKDWYIFTLAALMEADNKVLNEEVEYAKIFLDHMQITNDRFKEVVGNSRTLSGLFS